MRYPLSIVGMAVLSCLATACSSSTPTPTDASVTDVAIADVGTDMGSMDVVTPMDVATPMDVVTDTPVVTDIPVPVDSGPIGCTVSGSLIGSHLDEMDCLSAVSPTPEGVTTDVVIVDYTGVCGLFSEGASKANSRVLDLHFTGAPVTTRTYQVVTDPLEVQFQNLDGTCNAPSGESASTGTVTVIRVDSRGIAGTFDVTLNADHITGTFNAPRCAQTMTDAGSAGCR